jgi:hypothetical protein
MVNLSQTVHRKPTVWIGYNHHRNIPIVFELLDLNDLNLNHVVTTENAGCCSVR